MNHFLFGIAAYSAFAAAAHSDAPTFELLDAFEGLADRNDSVESCSFDTINNLWVLPGIFSGTYNTLPGSYPETPLTDGDFVTDDSLANFAMAILGTAFVESEATTYIAYAGTSAIFAYNVNTAALTLDFAQAGSAFGANGVCHDSANNDLYVTVTGLNFFVAQPWPPVNGATALYKIDVADPSSVTRIEMTDIVDQNGDGVLEANTLFSDIDGANRVFHPNGCVVSGGKVWMAESRLDATLGVLGIYDIAGDSFTVNTAMLPNYGQGDGAIAIGDYLIMTLIQADGTGGELVYYDMTHYPEGMFEVGLQTAGYADIDYNPNTNVICVPDLDGGLLEMVQFTPPEVTIISTTEETEETTAAADETTTADDGTGDSNANHICIAVAVVASAVSYIFM